MGQIPLTFFYDFDQIPDDWLAEPMREFAAAECNNVVFSDGQCHRLLQDPKYFCRAQLAASNAKVRFFEMHAPFGAAYDLNCSETARRTELIKDHAACMRYAADLGSKTYVIHTGAWDCVFNHHITIESMRKRSIESLERLLPYAEETGLVIAIENSFELSNTPDEVLYLLDYFKTPLLGCCFDTGHANYMLPNLDGSAKRYSEYQTNRAWRGNPVHETRALEKLLPHIVTCHIHDNSGFGDDHALPGSGTTPWNEWMPKLLGAPRLLSLQSEVSIKRNRLSIAETCRTIKQLVTFGKLD